MLILGIETAVEHVGVALGDHRGTLASATVNSDRRHAESLAPMIEFVCAQAGVTLRQLGAVAVDIGPGLFTGLRVGVAAAQSLAWALDIPVVPMCSLDVLAHRMSRTEDDVVAAALDARRGEMYWAVYKPGDGRMTRLSAPVVTPPDDCAIHLAERDQYVTCVGSGFVRHQESFEALTRTTMRADEVTWPSIDDLVSLAGQRASREEWVEAHMVEPLYLRAPDAEINWATRDGR